MPLDFGSTGIASNLGFIAGPRNKTAPLFILHHRQQRCRRHLRRNLEYSWNWDYRSVLGSGGNCHVRDTDSGTATLTVNMTVTNNCQITAPNISTRQCTGGEQRLYLGDWADLQYRLYHGQRLHRGAK